VTPRTDVARLLGATGPGAWALAALYGVTYVVIGFWSGGEYTRTPLGLTGLALMIAAAVILVLPQLSPLPRLAAAGVVAASVIAVAAGLWQLEPDGWRGWVTWYIGATSYLSFTLALRGRFWWGVGQQLALTAVAVHWTGTTTGDPLRGLELVYHQLILFGAGAFFAVWLRRTADRIAAFQETRLRREAAEGARSAADEERARELRGIRDSAGTALARIAAGTVTDEERREHLLLEAELRDRIRGRDLAIAPLTDAARNARRRGSAVALLDDLRSDTPSSDTPSSDTPTASTSPADAPLGDRLREAIGWAADRVAGSGGSDVTVRLTRADGEPVVTFATADGGAETFSLRVR
jgi:hypothetical protein